MVTPVWGCGRKGGCALRRMAHPLRFSGAEDAGRGKAQRMGHPAKFPESPFTCTSPDEGIRQFNLFCEDVARQYIEQAPCEGCNDESDDLKADAIEVGQHFASFADAGTFDKPVWVDRMGYT
jgi:hypothetical protein